MTPQIAATLAILTLTGEAQEPSRRDTAPVVALIIATVLGAMILGSLPIAIPAVAGAALFVLPLFWPF